MACTDIVTEEGRKWLPKEDLVPSHTPSWGESICKVGLTLWAEKMTPLTQHLPAICLAG